MLNSSKNQCSTFIEIDTKQFLLNITSIKNIIGHLAKDFTPKLCLPVKAHAYGHGLIEISKLAQPHVDYLAVARTEEGVILRQNGLKIPILVFGTFNHDQITTMINHDLEITISSISHAEQIIKHGKQLNKTARIHIKIDTGMNRIGSNILDAYKIIDFVIKNNNQLKLTGVYSHLASSDIVNDRYTNHQIELFAKIVDYVKTIDNTIIAHIANSGGLCHYPNSLFDMVRPGILSYGYFPNTLQHQALIDQLEFFRHIKPCFSLKTYVSFLKTVPKGSAISYNQEYRTTIDNANIATLPIGYGDGLNRQLSNCGQVLINGKRYTISGTICMDMTMVDIGNTVTCVGEEVVIIGQQNDQTITLESIAKQLNSITYEILCNFNDRISRIYI